MPKNQSSTPVEDAIDKTGGPLFVVDQMCDTLERAKIAAQGRTNDLSIRWISHPVEGADESEGNVWETRFAVSRDGEEPQTNLTVDEAKSALDAMGAA